MAVTLGEAIAKCRGESHSQFQLALALGMTPSGVAKWEQNERQPKLVEITRVEEACGRPRGFILALAGFVTDEGLKAARDALKPPRRVVGSAAEGGRPKRK